MGRRWVVAATLCLAVLAGCEPTERNAIFQNLSDTTVTVYDVGTDGTLGKVGDLKPNSELAVNLFTDGCSIRAYVLTNSAQDVLKRFDLVCYQETYTYP